MKRPIIFLIIVLSIVGILDTTYLTFDHFTNTIPYCADSAWIDCGAVLKSAYSVIWGIPLTLIGLIYYATIFVLTSFGLLRKNRLALSLIIGLSMGGLLFSIILLYLQIAIIHAICLYCTLSGIVTTSIFLTSFFGLANERKYLFVFFGGLKYRTILRPIFFLFDSETIHEFLIRAGEVSGKFPFVSDLLSFILKPSDPRLSQKVAGINFRLPVGLAAGFDYEARLTQVLPAFGFGFETVGTITNGAYEGNPTPRLGRLVKSRSLLVNKGFKNLGALATAQKLSKMSFEYPVGVSIGKTNTLDLTTQKDSVNDILKAYQTFEEQKVGNAFYELNISCPNLKGNISFYPPKNLEELLAAVDKLKLTKPLFVKMPIEKTNEEFVGMLEVIVKHKIAGIIIGNLQKNRLDPAIDPEEAKKYPVGNFSGRPTYDRSNELISLTYKKYGKKLTIIGCGGVFNANQAWEKITRGATIVQLVTATVFEGPTIVSKINLELAEMVEKNGFSNISQVVGSKN
jgi:dihydroorotate dehydrogenase subfamily 2